MSLEFCFPAHQVNRLKDTGGLSYPQKATMSLFTPVWTKAAFLLRRPTRAV